MRKYLRCVSMPSLRSSRPSLCAFLSQVANAFSARKMRRFLCVQWMLILMLLALPVNAGAQTAHFSGAQLTLGGGFNLPAGVAVDGSGNVFVADETKPAVNEIPYGCLAASCVKTLGSGFYPTGVAVDGNGNVYVADNYNGAVKEILAVGGSIPASPTIKILGGGFGRPNSVAVDGTGNVFVTDSLNNAVYEILAAGGYTVVETLGSGFYHPTGVAVDGGDNVFVADYGNSALKEILSAGGYTTIKTLGSGLLSQPHGVALDGSGNLYVADLGAGGVYELLATGGYTTEITVASEVGLPWSVAADENGNVYIANTGNYSVVELETAAANFGTVAIGQTSVASTLTFTFDTGGTISNPVALTQGAAGLDFAVASGGTCTAGTYSAGNTCTVNVTFTPRFAGLRSGAVLLQNTSKSTVATGYVDGIGSGPQVAFGIGIITAVAGNGAGCLPATPPYNNCYNGDNIAATSAELGEPRSAVVDGAGNIYIADEVNQRIRKVNPGGIITTVAGNGYGAGTGQGGYSGDGGPAISAELSKPVGVALDGAGNLYIAEYSNQRIRKVTPSGIITTVAGNGYGAGTGQGGYSGDGGPATSAELSSPSGVVVDGAGNLYIVDEANSRIRKVTPGGIITTVAGNGSCAVSANGECYNGDNIAATSAELSGPSGVAVDGAGNLYIADTINNRIRKVTPGGIITTVAGNGTFGYAGDSGPATSAEFSYPDGVAVDGAGNLYIADFHSGRIRKVTPGGTITTVAGGESGCTGEVDNVGDGCMATNAYFAEPEGVAVDGSGNLYIADPFDGRIRKVDVSDAPSLTYASTNVGGASASQDVTLLNLGNAPLNISQISTAANFSLGGSDNSCSSVSQTLASAASCVLGIEFNPTASGSISGSVILTDNSLNVSGATQQVQLSGTGNAVQASTTTAAASLSTPFYYPTYNVTLSANVTSAAGTVNEGIVNFTVGTLNLTASGAVVNGTATATVTIPTDTYPGIYPITAAFAGTPNFAASADSSHSFSIMQASTTTTLTSSLNPSSYGQSVMLTAAIVDYAGVSPLTGSVTFFDGATSLGNVANSAGQATLTLSSFGTGMHLLTAQYSGSATRSGSASAVLTQTVTAPVVTTTQSSMNFGSTAVGSSIGNTQSFSFAVPSGLTLGGISAVTQGAPNLDFKVTGGTCAIGTTSATCTVQVQFLPTAVGTRLGAVVLTDQSNNTLITLPLQGTGTGPLVAFGPGIIATLAGNGTGGYNGDSIAATSAELDTPNKVALDSSGNLYVADAYNNRIRKVTPAGTITTVAGTGYVSGAQGQGGYNGDNIPATSAELSSPMSVAVDGAGNLYIADYYNERIRKVDTSGNITTVAGNGYAPGNGQGGYNGDNIPATVAELNGPSDIAVDGAGNLYIADRNNHRIRKVDTSGNITTVAGNGTPGYNGDNIAATGAELDYPWGVAVDGLGNLYIADWSNSRVREVTPNGTITTVAGTGTRGYNGDNIPATSAEVGYVPAIAVDGAGSLYIADASNYRIRKVTPGGTIATVAGTGTAGYNGDNITATSAELDGPHGIAIDGAGSLYIAEDYGNRVRKVDVSDAPSLAFANTNIGTASASQDVTVLNLGNAPLTISQISTAANFSLGGSDTTCGSTGQTLASAASCVVGIEFNPTTAGGISGSVVLTNNALNASAATQTIALQGTGIGLQSQTITLSNPGPQTYGVSPIALTGSPSSGLAVSYSVTSGPATVSGSALTITGAGSVTVQGNQAGNTNYTAATPVSVTFTVAQAPLTISPNSFSRAAGATNPAFTGTVAGVENNDLNAGNLVITYSTTATTSSPIGTYPITASISGVASANYALTVNPAKLTVLSSGVDLIESAVSGPLTAATGGTIQVTDTVLNQGGGIASASTTGFYLSTNGTTKGTYLGYRYVPALSAGASSGPVTTTFTLPTNLSGTYYLMACANYNNGISESNTSNNCTASASFTVAGADLVESIVGLLTTAPISGGSVQVTDTVLNQGGGIASASTTGFYLSTNGTTKGTYLGYRNVPALSAGAGSGPVTTTFTLPTSLSGTYYLMACANYTGAIVESNTSNDCTASGSFTVAGADLVESTVGLLTTAPISGGSVQMTDTVLNQGGGIASASTTGFYLSTNGTTKGTYLGYRYVPALSAGASSGPVTTTFTLPTSLSGTYYLMACANYNNGITESNASNDCTASASFTVAGADLVESAVSILTTAPAQGGTLQVSDTVLNQGAGIAGASNTGFYLSTNGVTKGTYLGYRNVGTLSSGASSGPITTTFTLPSNAVGTYYVIVCANYTGTVVESNATNNCTASANTMLVP
jgi:sugar lactone lactonase YvrE